MQTHEMSKRNHLLEMLVPFIGMLAPYKISILPLSAIVLMIIFLFQRRPIRVTFSKQLRPYLLFLAYMVARDLLHMCFSISDPISVQFNRLIEDVVMYALIFLICDDFDEDVLFRWWKIAGVVFGVGMVYHVILLFLGRPIEPISIVPGYSIGNASVAVFRRPTSFFSEPAAYITSMMPLLFLSLKKKKLIWAALSTFLIALSTSTVGVVLAAVLWSAFILLERKSHKTTFIYLLFVALLVVLFVNLPIFSDTLQKLEAVSEGGSTWGSRIEGPFQIVGAMNWYELPFGTSTLDPRAFISNHNFDKFNLSLIVSNQDGYSVFLNTIASLIFRYGIVGLCLFLLTFKKKILNNRYEARIYAIMLLVAAFAQGSVAEPGIGLIIILLYANKMNKPITKQSKNQIIGDKL